MKEEKGHFLLIFGIPLTIRSLLQLVLAYFAAATSAGPFHSADYARILNSFVYNEKKKRPENPIAFLLLLFGTKVKETRIVIIRSKTKAGGCQNFFLPPGRIGLLIQRFYGFYAQS